MLPLCVQINLTGPSNCLLQLFFHKTVVLNLFHLFPKQLTCWNMGCVNGHWWVTLHKVTNLALHVSVALDQRHRQSSIAGNAGLNKMTDCCRVTATHSADGTVIIPLRVRCYSGTKKLTGWFFFFFCEGGFRVSCVGWNFCSLMQLPQVSQLHASPR